MAVHAELMPAAIVLGMSPHGLAIARALARNGIHVLAFEQALSLPAVATRYATVRQANALNTAYAADILLKYREERGAARPAVLFASSDNIIRAIADRWSELRTGYRTSWAPSVALVAKLIDKSNLEAICRERGLDYPASVLMTDVSDIPSAIAAVGFPLLAKPVRPLSGFKAMRIDNRAALELLAERQVADLPFLIQRWIPGGDDTLYFCSMVLDQGRPVAAFTGRKVEAYPPGTGVGTIVESWHDREVLGLAHRFIEGLDLSGPIAIEFKRDPQGKFWLIEPNVGRTEYSVDLIIQSGINFPLLEYQLALGLPLTAPAVQRREVVWYDTDRDPLCYLRRCRREGSLRPRSKQRVFPYWGHADAGPLWRATRRFTAKVLAKFREVVEPDAARHGVRVERVARAADLPEEARQLISQLTGGNIFLSPAWFEIFEREVALHEGPHFWALIYGPGGALYGAWPFMERRQRGRRVLRATGNYYSPYMTLPFRYKDVGAMQVFKAALHDLLRGFDVMEIEPIAADDGLTTFLEKNPRPSAFEIDAYSTNWYQPLDSLDDYFAARPGRLRTLLQRKRRALARDADVEFELVVAPGPVLEDAIKTYFEVYEKSWKRPEPYPEFIAEFVRLAAREGWLRLGLLRVNGIVVASQIWLVAGGSAYIYKLAYDEKYGQYSVGSQLTWHLFEHVSSRDGVQLVDYLTGNDTYKRDWMDQSRQLVTVTFINLRRPLGALSYLKWQLSGRRRRDDKAVDGGDPVRAERIPGALSAAYGTATISEHNS